MFALGDSDGPGGPLESRRNGVYMGSGWIFDARSKFGTILHFVVFLHVSSFAPQGLSVVVSPCIEVLSFYCCCIAVLCLLVSCGLVSCGGASERV